METSHAFELEILIHGLGPSEIQAQLTKICADGLEGLTFQVRKKKSRFRSSFDASVLVAIVAASGTVFGALMAGLLAIAKQRQAGKIIIRDKDGLIIEFPVNTDMETIDSILEKVKNMDQPRILL